MYEFGKKIFDKIQEQIKPEFEDETAVNPFNFWEGANFKLKIRQVEGYRNYDKSEFEKPTAISEDDDEIEKIWKQSYSLKAFLDTKLFKTDDELTARLNKALGVGSVPAAAATRRTVSEDVEQEESRGPVDDTPPFDMGTEDEDALSYFSKLAEED